MKNMRKTKACAISRFRRRLLKSASIAFLNLIVLSAALMAPPLGLSQVRTVGQIVGTVQDTQGAVVTGADIKIQDEATGAAQSMKVNQEGKFIISNLLPGHYKITVSYRGFRTAVLSGIKVDAARTTDVTVTLEAGDIAETVQVVGGAEVLERTSTAIESTVRGDTIRNLPLNNRDTLDFVLLMPGAQQGGQARQSTFLGLPKGAINITMDGVNVQDNLLKSAFGGGMFTITRPRLDAVEEVTVKTATAGADAAGEGAVQIQFITRRGTNNLRGTVFWDHRNDALNGNTWFNNARNLRRPRNLLNVFGGNTGGPVWKEKVFFFFNYEEFRLPESRPRENSILTPEAMSGIFRYQASDGSQRTGNVLQIAAAAGFPSTIDPTVGGMLQQIDAARGRGAISTLDLFRQRYRFESPSTQLRRFPTLRVDYNISSNLQWHGTWHYNYFSSNPDTLNSMDPSFPGITEPGKVGGQYSNRYSLGSALQWQITPTINNEFRFGLQGAPVQFFPESGAEIYPAELRVLWPLGLQSLHARPGLAATSRSLPSSRNTPVYNLQDNMSMVRGKHTMTFGGSLTVLTFLDNSFGGAGIPTVSFGVATGDPVSAIFSGTSMPGISSTDLPNARSLYALLTGRIASVSGSRNVDDQSKEYRHLKPLVQRGRQNEFGLYFVDSWRARPTLTLNYGLRWEFQGAVYNSNGIFTSPTFESLWGPSGVGNLFRPGSLNGVTDPTIDLRPTDVYDRDYKNAAPSFGLAWNPKFDHGILKFLFGESNSVFRGGYSISYTREGLSHFTTFAGGNPGLTQSITLTPGDAGFAPGGLLLRNALPTFREFPTSFAFPVSQSAFTFSTGNINAYDPNIKTPYVQSWSFGIQRELNKDTAMELRYVGNRGTKLWRSFNLNEVNIFENGFLDEFKIAQRNLAINKAAGVTSFANRGLPGQSPLPIFQAAFGARGAQPALSTAAGFGSGTFITLLEQGQAGSLANSLANSSTTLCRMVGSLLPACAARGFNAAGPFPINFFHVNPFAAGRNVFMLTNGAFSTYHGFQIEFRRRLSKGLTLNAHYTFSKSLTDLFVDSATSTSSLITLRNGKLDKGPSPWDLRHSFVANWLYELPFGPGRRFDTNLPVLNKVIEGWDVLGILRVQSGRVFKLTSGRAMVNQNDSGVILRGISTKELQELIKVRKDPGSQDIFFVPENLIGTDGRSNRAILDVPSTPGEFGSFIYLYGPRFAKPDLSLIKRTRVTERVNVEFWTEFFNAFNYQNFMIGGPGAAAIAHNIDGTTFGRTTDFFNDLGNQDPGPRMIQFRLRVNF